MSTTESQVASKPVRPRRPFVKIVLHWVRRAHLYLGLFLFPWAVLYGVTAFLFNHPTAFSDQSTTTFGQSTLTGTPLESPIDRSQLATSVLTALNERDRPDTPYTLVENESPRFVREFAFATVKAESSQVSILIDIAGHGGTVRETPIPKVTEKAPFVSSDKSSGRRPGGPTTLGGPRPSSSGIAIPDSIAERIRQSIPTILERTGFPNGEATITSIPDLAFSIQAEGRVWRATYNPLTGAVAGAPAETTSSESLSARRFLTRLHLAHGYPSSMNAKWFWAVIVDVMAAIMIFWGLSGLVMWWQIKAARWSGAVVLIVSACSATGLGFGMHSLFTG